jgi:hypothetical protein
MDTLPKREISTFAMNQIPEYVGAAFAFDYTNVLYSTPRNSTTSEWYFAKISGQKTDEASHHDCFTLGISKRRWTLATKMNLKRNIVMCMSDCRRGLDW